MFYYSIAALALASCVGAQSSTTCKPVFDSPDWPAATLWSRLNDTVFGRLIAPELPGAFCHADQPQYNNESCALLATQWYNTSFHAENPVTLFRSTTTTSLVYQTTNTRALRQDTLDTWSRRSMPTTSNRPCHLLQKLAFVWWSRAPAMTSSAGQYIYPSHRRPP
jgi:hypothetical protein